MEARVAKPGKTLTISYYWVANFKLDEINTEFKVKNQKKILTCKNNTLQKLKHGEIVKPAFKYITDGPEKLSVVPYISQTEKFLNVVYFPVN